MQIPSTLSIWLREQAWPFALIAIVLVLILAVVYTSFLRYRSKMTQDRTGVDEDSFVQSLEIHGFDRSIARSTYRYLQEKQRVSFPIHAEDLLVEDLGLDSEDVEESVQDLLNENERLYQPGLKHMPIVTVEDLLRFIQASPRLSELAA